MTPAPHGASCAGFPFAPGVFRGLFVICLICHFNAPVRRFNSGRCAYIAAAPRALCALFMALWRGIAPPPRISALRCAASLPPSCAAPSPWRGGWSLWSWCRLVWAVGVVPPCWPGLLVGAWRSAKVAGKASGKVAKVAGIVVRLRAKVAGKVAVKVASVCAKVAHFTPKS